MIVRCIASSGLALHWTPARLALVIGCLVGVVAIVALVIVGRSLRG